MGTYLTEALILKQQNYRETDRKVIFYSHDFGKQTAVARGSRKINSKLAGSLQPYTLCRLMLAKGKLMDTITASEIINNHRSIKNDLGKIRLAEYLGHVILETSREKHRDPKVYEVAKEAFFLLNQESQLKKNINYLLWYCLWNYLNSLGYQPELFKCVSCHKKILPKLNYFSLQKGGLICQICQPNFKNAQAIRNDTVKILRFVISHKYLELKKIKVRQNLIREMNKLALNYLNYSQELNLNWRKFLFFG